MVIDLKDVGPKIGLEGAATSTSPRARSLITARDSTMGGGKKEWTNPYITDNLIAMWDIEWNAGGGKHDAAIGKSVNLAESDIGDLSLPPSSWEIGDKHVTKIASGTINRSYPSKSWYQTNIVDRDGYAIEIVCNVLTSTGTTDNLFSICQSGGFIYGGGDLFGVTSAAQFNGKGVSSGLIWDRPFTPAEDKHYLSMSVAYSNRVDTRYDAYIGGRAGVGGISGTQYYDYHRNMISIGNGYDGQSPQRVGWMFSCVRIYNRYLSRDEVAANRAVDKARFGLA